MVSKEFLFQQPGNTGNLLLVTMSNVYWPWQQFVPPKPVFNQVYDYFLVLDFEATCENGGPMRQQEIIEFPVVKVNARTMRVEGYFHRYVKPTRRPSAFCTQLTGITEEMLINQPPFQAVILEFQEWLIHEGLINKRIIFVTCSNWDLRVMLPSQCNRIDYPVPVVMRSWINIKKAFSLSMGIYPNDLMHMLALLQLPHVGRLHSGLDDCLNTCAILEALARRGYVFHQTNSYIPPA